MGESNFNAVPIFEGNALSNCISKCEFGGKDIDLLLDSLQNNIFTTFKDTQVLKEIKHSLCYVSTDYQSQSKIQHEEFSICAEGNVTFKLANELFEATECIFNPSLLKDLIKIESNYFIIHY
jgi:actin-related protein